MKNLIIVILLAIIFFFVGKNAISEIEENQEDISTFIESFANEKPAEELYQKAQEQEEMRNFLDAKRMYQQILQLYPKTSAYKKAYDKVRECQDRLESDISWNESFIVDAMHNFRTKAFDGRSLKLDTAIQKTYELLYKNVFTSITYYDWEVNSEDNKIYTATKKIEIKRYDGGKTKTILSYKIDRIKQTISAIDKQSCLFLDDVYTCSAPIKLGGIRR